MKFKDLEVGDCFSLTGITGYFIKTHPLLDVLFDSGPIFYNAWAVESGDMGSKGYPQNINEACNVTHIVFTGVHQMSEETL